MNTLKVLGRPDDRLKIVEYGARLNHFSVSEAVQIAADRSEGDYQYLRDLQADDVVELIFEGDIHRWVTVEQLEKEYKYNVTRGESPEVLEIPHQLPASGAASSTRGPTAWVLKGLRILKYDPMEKLAKSFAEAWDEKLMPKPGLFFIEQRLLKAEKVEEKPDIIQKSQINAANPILLFLHGTFSSTKGSFGGLPADTWKKLREQYGEQIYGYDHYTLSKSPVQNALELVKELPDHAVLHLVTHSRGGLIGELLARTGRTNGDAFDADDYSIAATSQQASAKQDLIELAELLKSKNIRVERFVRIACPARGTTLVSDRLDRWLELTVNVVSKLLEPTAKALFGVLTDLLLDFKKQAANPGAIPGLAAMVPESSFIRMINRPDVQVDTDLYVIAGDVDKNDILGRLAIFFADMFYFEDHDLVVQTRAMYGGARRQNGYYFFDKGSTVNHFHYFSNLRTSEKILAALTIKNSLAKDTGFRPLDEAYEGKAIADRYFARSYQRNASLSQPVVYVIPGIMGSHLSENGQRIWLDLVQIAQGRIMNLQISSRTIQPLSLVGMAYGHLIEYLSATHEVIPFPFDWRMSILDEAERFADTIQAKLDETKQPIRIIAHSMGGLITRAMINLRPEVWEKICERDGSRFIMLGTPNQGAHKIINLILGQDQTLRMLAMLDFRNSTQQLLKVIAKFPGVLQLLPTYDSKWDFMDAGTWDKFPNPARYSWVRPDQADLDQAKKFRALLNSRPFTARDPVIYVAGNSPGAPVGVQLSDHGQPVIWGTNEGDGTVTWQSGILPELHGRTWYMSASHGNLCNHKPSFAAIYDLLQTGTTRQLSTQRPAVARGVDAVYPLREEQVEIYPDQPDLEQIVLGAEAVPLSASPVQPIRVSVIHGNFAFCTSPVAVGHYEGDGIFSAEKSLDYLLNGRLSARHRLSRYPGPEGTAEVIFNNPDQKPGGAVIVGLGKAGELSPRKLSESFANAMREYGILAYENQKLGPDGGFSISTLLIGAGGKGLSVASSVDAILNGALQANKSFALLDGGLQNVHISEVQFIELYKDQAILAARALRSYTGKPEIAADPQLRTLRGGFQRLAFEEPAGWWSRIYVRAGEADSLIFTLPTDRARAEESQQGVQRSNIEALVTQAVRDHQWDQKLAAAIFELMIPNPLKGSFRDLNNVLLVLDPAAAHYPWELIYDRRAGQDTPLAVQYGLIRQFSTSTFRERVMDVRNTNVLVVGNPPNLPDDFADLPGAQQEASLVEAKFRQFEYNVVPEINTGAISVMSSLFSNDYRVIHLAGHGVYDYPYSPSGSSEEKRYTGMVLGNDVFLTAGEINKKTEIPELVFINCCHLGKIDPAKPPKNQEFNKLAASLSAELINMGVKAVVAAGWAVDDAAAITFADVFYDNLLKGATFGESVWAARLATYNLYKDRTNTWAAYQCYGDPNYRLVMLQDGAAANFDRLVDLEEAVVEIKKLCGSARTTSVTGFASLREGLDGLQTRIDKECSDWLKDPVLQEALGDAFSEIFLFDKAIEYYNLALDNQKSGASLKAVEQRANLLIRKAVMDFERDPNCYDDSRARIRTEINKFKSLINTAGETSERRSMLGSGYKRLAQISAEQYPEECMQALKKMETEYKKAWNKDSSNPYPLTNLLAARVALLLRENDLDQIQAARPGLVDLASQATRLAKSKKANSPDDFWASIACTDAALIESLIGCLEVNPQSMSEKDAGKLSEEYQTAWRQSGSAREFNSVIENYTFLAAVLDHVESRGNVPGFLRSIVSSLKSTLA